MRTLREMIAADRAIAAPLVMNPIMAKLAERAGFEALYLGGASMGYLKTILEANLNLTEMIQAGVDIRAACSLPLILDAAADVLMLGARRPEEYEMVGERLGPPLMYNIRAGGLAALGMNLDDLGRLGCRLLTDPRHPFILAYRAWKDGYQALADGMLTPGLGADEVGEIERDMFETINLKALIDIEKRTVEHP